MKLLNIHRIFYIAAGLFLLLLSGCATEGNIKLPDLEIDSIRSYKQLNVYASWPHFKKTGIFLDKGDLFSIIISGKINTNPRKYPNRWLGPASRLHMMIDSNYYGYVPVNGTRESKYRGEIKFYINDGHFNTLTGKAEKPEWFKDNKGKFELTIIIWRTNNWDKIIDTFANLKGINTGNELLKETYEQTQRFKDYYLARMEAEQELEKTKSELGALKDSEPLEVQDVDKNITNKMGSAALAAVKKNEGKDAQIEQLEAKLAKLQETLAQLDDIKRQLEAEKEKSAKLAQELETKAAIEQSHSADPFPPFLLLASPANGMITSAPAINISGVAEDNQGLKSLEIYINGKMISEDLVRGIRISKTETSKRREFKGKISIIKGENIILVRAVDINDMVTEKNFVIHRKDRDRNIWAVIVGIDHYQSIPKLKYAVKDAQAIYQLLTSVNQIPPENVTLLLNEQATLTNLRSYLGTKLKQSASKDDMVIIYFAGHGATERDVTSPDGDGLEKYILPYDAVPKDLYASALPMREISHILNRIQSERLVFIADACYSGASGGRTVSIEGFRSNISGGFLGRISRGKGRVIITASGPNEVSAEDDKLKHGVFTYYLIEALEGKGDSDGDGLITVDEAYRYVSEAVPKATDQEQHPVKMGAVEGQLVLGVTN